MSSLNVLAIPATNSRTSINKQLLDYVASVLADDHDADVNFLDLNDHEMAIYSPEREEEGIPPEAQSFFDAIGSADAVVISFAEYNGSYTPAWKNTYDWASRIDSSVYQGKPVLMLAASPGPRAGAGVLGAATMAAPYLGAELVGSLGVGTFYDSFDGALVDPSTNTELRRLLGALAEATH